VSEDNPKAKARLDPRGHNYDQLTPEQTQLIDEMASDAPTEPLRFAITIDDSSQSFVATADGVEFGVIPFVMRDGRVTLLATSILPEFRGMGLATALIRRVLDRLREDGRQVTVRCPVFLSFLRRHPEYADLVGGRVRGPRGHGA
jgi:uncharacterized protein